jgi:uncharacterized protein
MVVLERFGEGLWNAVQMAWEVGWALVLGFLLSGIVQAWIPRERMQATLGGRDLRALFLATGLGAVLWVFLGWQFTLAEFVGGLLLVTLMWAGVRLLVTRRLEAEGRAHAEAARAGHEHTMAAAEDVPWRARSCSPRSSASCASARRLTEVMSIAWRVCAGQTGALTPRP